MHLPRFRLRTLLILIAVVAVGLGAEMMWRRAKEYRRRAVRYSRLEKTSQDLAPVFEEMARLSREVETQVRIAGGEENGPEPGESESDELSSRATAYRREVDYYAALARKYDRAARYPFLPVAPDPPEPMKSSRPRLGGASNRP